MTRRLASGHAASRCMTALTLLILVAACTADPTGTASLIVTAEPPAVAPPDDGQLCVDFITDDTRRICLIGQGFNGDTIRDPLSGAVACTCVYAGTH
ncbi:MAG: hypothetical protein ABI910_20385 [Gemmatimonadota bacterium]